MNEINKEFILSNEDIKACLSYFDDIKAEEYDIEENLIKLKFSYEEVLLKLQEFYGSDKKFYLKIFEKHKKLNIVIKYNGINYNPLIKDYDNENIDYNYNLLENLNLGLLYKVNNKDNFVYCCLNKKRKLSFISNIIIFSFLGILIGLLLNNFSNGINENVKSIFNPISSTLFGLIKMISLPLIFISITLGIANCGNINNFGILGKKSFLQYFKIMIFLEIITFLMLFFTYPLKILIQVKNNNFIILLIDTLVGMIPTNILKPFYDENCVQIVVLGIIFGCSILILKDKVNLISELFNQAYDILKMILEWFCNFIPLIVLIIIVNFFIEKYNFNEFYSFGKAILIYFLSQIMIILYKINLVRKKTKYDFKTIFKYFSNPFIKAFSTASTYCAYFDIIKCLENDFKLSKSQSEFNLALGVTFFKQNFVAHSVVIFYLAYVYNLEISLSWIVTFIILNILFSISTPSIAGSGIVIISLLFDIFLNGHNEFLGLVTFFLIIIDFANAGMRVLMMMCEIILLDDKSI